MPRYREDEVDMKTIKVGDMVKQIIPPKEGSPTRDLSGMLLRISKIDSDGYGGFQFFDIPMRDPSHFFGAKRFKKVYFKEKLDILLGSEDGDKGTGS